MSTTGDGAGVKITLDFLPPEECSPKWHGPKSKQSKAKRVTREATCMAAKSVAAEPLEYVYVDILCVCATEQYRDPDNWGVRCEPIINGLRDAGVIKFNDIRHLILRVHFKVDEAGAPKTIITVSKVGGNKND